MNLAHDRYDSFVGSKKEERSPHPDDAYDNFTITFAFEN